ncbi:hypothetical protein BDZ89DRAFT_1055469, partial [Hymenopellis radicata]
ALDRAAFDIELPKKKKQKTGHMKRIDPLQQLGSGSQTISWIWMMEGAVREDVTELNGTVRVEWEEARFLVREKENMQLSFEVEACEWDRRAEPWDALDEAKVKECAHWRPNRQPCVKEFEEEEESDDDEVEEEALWEAHEDALNEEDTTLDDD